MLKDTVLRQSEWELNIKLPCGVLTSMDYML